MLTWSYILGDFFTFFLPLPPPLFFFAVLLIVIKGIFFLPTSVISLIFLPCPCFSGFLTGQGKNLSYCE